jgi:hypothetical protein
MKMWDFSLSNPQKSKQAVLLNPLAENSPERLKGTLHAIKPTGTPRQPRQQLRIGPSASRGSFISVLNGNLASACSCAGSIRPPGVCFVPSAPVCCAHCDGALRKRTLHSCQAHLAPGVLFFFPSADWAASHAARFLSPTYRVTSCPEGLTRYYTHEPEGGSPKVSACNIASSPKGMT